MAHLVVVLMLLAAPLRFGNCGMAKQLHRDQGTDEPS
jgi:hypothetical protein